MTFREVRSLVVVACFRVRLGWFDIIKVVSIVWEDESKSSFLRTVRSTLLSSGNSLKGEVY